MKTKLNQSKLKLAIVSAMSLRIAGLSHCGYAATDTATWQLARQFRCPALLQPER